MTPTQTRTTIKTNNLDLEFLFLFWRSSEKSFKNCQILIYCTINKQFIREKGKIFFKISSFCFDKNFCFISKHLRNADGSTALRAYYVNGCVFFNFFFFFFINKCLFYLATLRSWPAHFDLLDPFSSFAFS